MTARSTRLIGAAIALVQVIDIIIHAASDQLEPLRVTSNVVILLWLAAMATGRIKANFRPVAIGVVGLYLVLNIIFLALEGVTNPAQGGALRLPLFVLVLLTLVLSLFVLRSSERPQTL